jgi:hypothetical protein
LRRAAIRLCVVVAGVLVAWVIAEIVFRIAGLYPARPRTYVGEAPNGTSKNFVADERVGWRLRPDHRFVQMGEARREILYAADANGFRIDPGRKPAPGAKHLAAVGDSFTFGAGVFAEESYPVIVANDLGGLALTNVAQPGYAFDQVWQSLVHEALPRRPDLIVAGVYPEDFDRSFFAYRRHEALNKPTFKLENGSLVPATADDRPGPIVRFLERRSRVFALSREISLLAAFRLGIGDAWNLNRAMLDEMSKSAAAARIPIVWVHIPFKTLDPFPALAAYMKETGGNLVDPVEDMKTHGELYFKGNMHLNVAGQRFVATKVVDFIRGRPELLARVR